VTLPVRARLGALSESGFRLLWLGQTLSRLGDAMMLVAIPFAVIELTGSATDLGLVLATFMVSRLALILVGGVWADRLSRRLVMLAADVARASTQGAAALLLVTGNAELWHLAAAAAATGVGTAFFDPASTALVPQTVSREKLQQANALIALSRSGARIFGPAAGAFLVAAFGPGWAYAADAATYLASAGFLLALRLPAAVGAIVPKSFLADLKEGWLAVRARTWLWTFLAVAAVVNTSAAAFVVLGPVVAERELGGAAAWGIVLTGGAVGGVVGGLIALRLRPRRPLVVVYLAVLPVSLPLALLIEPAPVLALAAGYLAFVAGVALSNTIWNTLVQERIPEETLARVSSYDMMVTYLFMPLGYTLAGPLADAVGLTTTLVAAVVLATAAPLLVLLVPQVRNLRATSNVDAAGVAHTVESAIVGHVVPPPRPSVGAGATKD
jgi:MFS family permease